MTRVSLIFLPSKKKRERKRGGKKGQYQQMRGDLCSRSRKPLPYKSSVIKGKKKEKGRRKRGEGRKRSATRRMPRRPPCSLFSACSSKEGAGERGKGKGEGGRGRASERPLSLHYYKK